MKSASTAVLALLAVAGAANAQIANGDFQLGNDGSFYSGFNYETTATVSPPGGLYLEGTYSVVSHDTIHPSWGDFYDHTFGDQRGLYLIANGATNNTSAGPAWGQVVAVNPNTDYTLSGWFASLYSGAPSAAEFRIDGVLVVPSFQLGSTVGAWEPHSVTFNSGASTSVTIEIWDTSGIANGNDYAIDDLTLTPTPGAAAMIGLGGLAMSRRRRR